VTLFSRFSSNREIDTAFVEADWTAPQLGILQKSSSITFDTANLALGDYQIQIRARFWGDGSGTEKTSTFTLKVVDSFDRLELINKRSIISFKERAAFFVRLHLNNNSYQIVDPKHITWQTSNLTRLPITAQGIVTPTSASLLEGKQTTYTVSATFQGRSLQQAITISPLETATGRGRETLESIQILDHTMLSDRIPGRYKAIAVYSNGKTRDVTEVASWSLGDSLFKHWRLAPMYKVWGGKTEVDTIAIGARDYAYGGEQGRISAMYEGVVAHTIFKNPITELVLKLRLPIPTITITYAPDGAPYPNWASFDTWGSIRRYLDPPEAPVMVNPSLISPRFTTSSEQLTRMLNASIRPWPGQTSFTIDATSLPEGEYTVTLTGGFRGRGFDEQLSATMSFGIVFGERKIVEQVFLNAGGVPLLQSQVGVFPAIVENYRDPCNRFFGCEISLWLREALGMRVAGCQNPLSCDWAKPTK
jgi:hypothetical protein